MGDNMIKVTQKWRGFQNGVNIKRQEKVMDQKWDYLRYLVTAIEIPVFVTY